MEHHHLSSSKCAEFIVRMMLTEEYLCVWKIADITPILKQRPSLTFILHVYACCWWYSKTLWESQLQLLISEIHHLISPHQQGVVVGRLTVTNLPYFIGLAGSAVNLKHLSGSSEGVDKLPQHLILEEVYCLQTVIWPHTLSRILSSWNKVHGVV